MKKPIEKIKLKVSPFPWEGAYAERAERANKVIELIDRLSALEQLERFDKSLAHETRLSALEVKVKKLEDPLKTYFIGEGFCIYCVAKLRENI